MKSIKCTGLTKRYKSVEAVAGVDLEIDPGECFGLLGPNGAGKTTTTEMLEGLLVPDAGKIFILGSAWSGGGGDRVLREKLGVALQETELTESLTVEETLRMFSSFYEKAKSAREVAGLLGLTSKLDTWVGRLSGGQRQRLALACALVGSPEILFLDEPTTGLDPQARMNIWNVIGEFKSAGGTVFLTTHYMEEAERLCDRVGVMEKGKLIALGTPKSLIDSLDANHVIEIEAETPLDEMSLLSIDDVCSVDTQSNGMVKIGVNRLETALVKVLNEYKRLNINISFLRTRRASLEDVFVNLTGRGLRDG